MGVPDDARHVRLVVCDVGGLTGPDAATVDALARLQLTVRRRGGRVTLRNASRELLDLLALAGLDDAIPMGDVSALQGAGQTEQGEQLRVEEQRHPHDPLV